MTDAAGVELARGEGTGSTIDWTWLPVEPVPAGSRWRIEAPGATPAEGALSATSTALRLAAAAAVPAAISPNGDGQGDTATVSFTLSADANVAVTLLDAYGATVAELEPRRWRRAGARNVVVDGKALQDGSYLVHVVANATGGREATVDVPLTVTRTLGRVTLDPSAMTPNGDGRADTLTITVPLTAPATVTVRILRDGHWVATPFTGPLGTGEHIVSWDGKKRLGKAREGTYVASIEAADEVGTSRVELPFLLDATAPTVRVVATQPPRLWVSEAATLTVWANGARRTIRAMAAGTHRIAGIERLRTLVVVARDAAGNESVLRR